MTSSPEPMELAVIVGSLRTGSVHRVVAMAAAELAPGAVTLTEVPIVDVPFYNQDIEDAGEHPAVAEMRAVVNAADGLVFVTPEYNGSMPAVVKNAVDWLSRPYGSGAIAAKPTMIIAATPGRHDAASVRAALATSAGIAGASVHEPTHGIASVTRMMEDGELSDPDTRAALADALAAFVATLR